MLLGKLPYAPREAFLCFPKQEVSVPPFPLERLNEEIHCKSVTAHIRVISLISVLLATVVRNKDLYRQTQRRIRI